jgi:bacteriocin biosynthesis cyclodehydratase domain-containing protein
VTRDEHADSRAPDRGAVVDPEGQLTLRAGAPPTGGAPRYRLRGSLELFFASDGDAYLLRGGTGREHVVRAPDEADRELLRRLARDGVEADPSGPIAARLAPLLKAGAIVPEPATGALGAIDAERFARQLPYFEDFGDPVAAQRTLRSSCVAILGCGGLGTWALAALASLGVGRLLLIDDDTLELSNLNRQVLYGAGDVGAAKVDLAARWVAAFDPAIEVVVCRQRVRGPSDLDAVAGCAALLLTADYPPYQLSRWVNEACLAHGVPFITAGQQPPLVKIGPTFAPGRGACFECHEHGLRRDFPLYDELVDQRRRESPAATTLGPSSGLIGTVLALEVAHLLLGHWPLATHERAWLIDIRTLSIHWEAISANPRCPRCSARSRERG